MARMVDNINVPMARASILWLIGEYSPSLLDIIYIALFIVSFRPPHTRTLLDRERSGSVVECLTRD